MPKLDKDILLIGKFGGAIALGHPIGCTGARITTIVERV